MRRHAGVVAAALVCALLSGCERGETNDPDQDPATEGATMTGRVDEAAARAQAPQVRAILQEVWDQFDLEGKPALDDKPGDGRLRACTLDTMTHITSWAEGAQMRVAEEEKPELEARQAELARAWLSSNGYELLDNPAPESDPVSYHRNSDGFIVTVTPWGDARVGLDVRSPCFDEDGERVTGTSSRP